MDTVLATDTPLWVTIALVSIPLVGLLAWFLFNFLSSPVARADLLGRTPLEPLDLLRMAAAGIDDGESRIQRVYEWQLERQAIFVTAVLPIIAPAAIALASPFFKGHHHLLTWQAILLGAAIVISAGTAAISIRLRAHALYRRYLAAMRLYALLRRALT